MRALRVRTIESPPVGRACRWSLGGRSLPVGRASRRFHACAWNTGLSRIFSGFGCGGRCAPPAGNPHRTACVWLRGVRPGQDSKRPRQRFARRKQLKSEKKCRYKKTRR